MPDWFRLADPEGTSTDVALPYPAVTPSLMLPGKWQEAPWRLWAPSPAPCIPVTLELGTSLFRKPFPARECAAGLECGTFPVCGTYPESGGLGTCLVRICPTLYSSAFAGKSESYLILFRNTLVLIPLLIPRWLVGCVPLPPLLLPHTRFRLGIRVGPGIVPASVFRWTEATSGCPRTGHSSNVSISRVWEWSSGRRWGSPF